MNQQTDSLDTDQPSLTTEEREDVLRRFAALYPFALDDFQLEAINTFLDGESVMVAAPTGTGKTIVAEFGVYESFRRRGKVIYTTPIKALSNQKFRDLRELYGPEVGLLTGDVTENPGAEILVMTTEVLRNMLLQTPWQVDQVDCVIFDEVHYIADPERGTTWEEAIILCPKHVQLICLSATVSNADEIADWISRTHRPIRLITHLQRAIPLALFYYLDKQLRLVIDHEGNQVGNFANAGGEIRRKMGRHGSNREQRRMLEQLEPQPWEVLNAMEAADMLPAIYFLFSRRDCEDFAQRYAMVRSKQGRDPDLLERIDAFVDGYIGQMRVEDQQLEQVKLIRQLVSQGIAFHHAGLLPVLKQLVEVLFTRGLLQVVFATDTLALGVNMPARSVVIGRMTKWDGRQRRMLIPNEFQQMAGRAGRRGMDNKGNVIVPHSPWMRFGDMMQVATGPLEPVISSFSIRYNTVLNLWDPPEGERVRTMLQQSLAQFQSAQRVRELEDDIVDLSARISELPQGCLIGYDNGEELLDEYRGLSHSVDALRSRERTLAADMHRITIRLESRPWPEPTRQSLRRVLRTAQPGLVMHLRDAGWGVYLARADRGGVGYFLSGDSVELLNEYRQIDYLPAEQYNVNLPDGLMDVRDPVADVTTLISAGELAHIRAQIAALPLPDLAAQATEHRAELLRRNQAEMDETASDLEAVHEQTLALETMRDNHLCHACPRRKEHLNNRKRIVALERERGRVEKQLRDEIAAEEERIRGIIRGIRNVLHRFNYLHDGYPTTKTDLLADIFDTNGLIICEMIDRGMIDDLSPADVAEVFSWFAFDRDSRFANHYNLPLHLITLRQDLEDMEQQVLAAERINGLFISHGHNIGFYGALRAWCNGATMSTIAEQIDLSEGDLVLTFNKTIDVMRQVREMLSAVAPTHPLRETLSEAERLVKRDIIAQSLALGFLPIDPEAGDLLEAEAEIETQLETEA